MNSMSRFTITAADLQFSHDVSGEARNASGKWTDGTSHADVKSHVATKLGVHPEVIAYAAKLKAMKTSERENVDFYTNHIGYQYFEAHKLMPKSENDAKFKKLTDGNNFTLSSDAGYLANVNGHPFLLNQWKDPDAKFRNDPKEFVWAYCPAGATEFIETHTRDPEELVQIIQSRTGKLAMNQFSHSEGEHEFSSTQFNIEGGGYSRSQGSPLGIIRLMADKIDDDDLSEDGREDEFHVTVKYGIHADTDRNLRRVVADFGSVEITLGKTAMFPAKDEDGQDVVYVEVFGDDIHRLNKLICANTKCTDTHPSYVPHICLSYCKPGKGRKYVGDDSVEGQRLFFTEFQFSNKNRQKTQVSLVDGIKLKHNDTKTDLAVGNVQYATLDSLRGTTNGAAVSAIHNDWISRFSITAHDVSDEKRDSDGKWTTGGTSAKESVDAAIRPHPTQTPQFKAWFGDSKVVDGDGKPLVVYHGTGEVFDSFDASSGKDLGGFGGDGVFFSESPSVASSYSLHQSLAHKNEMKQQEKLESQLESFRNSIAEKTDTSVPSERNVDRWMSDLLDDDAISREEYDKHYQMTDELHDFTESSLPDPQYETSPNVTPAYLSMKSPKVINANGLNWDIVVPQAIESVDRSKHDGIIFKNVKDSGDESDEVTTNYFVFHPNQIKSAVSNSGEYDPSDARINMSRFSITAEDLDLFEMGQLTFNFDESKHPRGHEGNPGQFVKKGEGKAEPAKTPVAKPTPVAEKPKSTMTKGQSTLIDQIDTILTDRHPARGRMTPAQLLQNTLENIPTEDIRELANHPGIDSKSKLALVDEIWRRSEARKSTLAEDERKKKEAEQKVVEAKTPKSPRKTISEITGHKATRDHVDATLNHITKLHSVLPSTKAIPVKTTSGKQTVGQFHYYPVSGEPLAISVSSNSPHPRLTFAHEYGHFMDLELGKHIAGRGAAFASTSSRSDYNPGHPAEKLLDAIHKSKATSEILGHIRGPGTVKRKVQHPKLGEVEVSCLVNKSWLRYLLQPEEQFARAYSQYVATRSGDESMKTELAETRKQDVSEQWADDDFEPIAKAFDEYFEAVGLTKGK